LFLNHIFFIRRNLFFFSSRRRHTSFSRDWSSDVCSSDLGGGGRRTQNSHRERMTERVLIADVDPDILQVVRVNLELEGYQVETRSEERRVGKESKSSSLMCIKRL